MPTLPYLTDTSTQLSGTYTTSIVALDNYATSNYVNSFWTTSPTNPNLVYLNKPFGISSGGRVGIGITLPTGALEISNSIDPYNLATGARTKFGSKTANTARAVNQLYCSDAFYIYSADAAFNLFYVGYVPTYDDPQPRTVVFGISRTALTMTGDGSFSGNFAVGTTPGTYKLNVNGSLNSTSLYQNGTLIDFSSYATNANLTTNYYNKTSTDTLLNAKENTLTFSSPLTRTTNTIGINLSAYSTSGTDPAYVLKTGSTMTGALLNTSTTASEFKGIYINHTARITHIPYLPDGNIYFRAPLIIDNPNDYLSFGSRTGDNIIRLYGTDFGFGINGATLRYNVPAGSVHRFYHGTTNTAWIDDTGRLKATTFEGSGASLTNVPYTALTGTVPFYTKAENDNLLSTKQATLTVATTLLGTGGSITSLDYNKITTNPLSFTAPLSKSGTNVVSIDLSTYALNTTLTTAQTNNSNYTRDASNALQTNINTTNTNLSTNYYNKSSTDTLLNAKEQILTFSSPLIRTTNTISINLGSYSTSGTDPAYVLKSGSTMTGLLTGTTINATTALQEAGTNLSSKYLALAGGTLTGTLTGTTINATTALQEAGTNLSLKYLLLSGGTLTGDLTGTNITGTKVNCADATGVNAACLGRLLNVVGTNAIMRIWRDSTTNSPAMEFMSGPMTSGTSYTKLWDMGIGGSTGTNFFYIRDRKPPSTSLNRLIIDDSGNIGIGTTTNASYRLNIEGSLNTTSINATGNVGIGNPTPLGSLSIGRPDVVDNDGTLVISKRGSGNRNFKFGYDTSFNFCMGDFGGNTSGNTWVSTQFNINWSSGNVGIGAINQSQKLYVNGTAAINSDLTVVGTTYANGDKLNFPNTLNQYKINLWGTNEYGFGIAGSTLQYSSAGSHTFYKSGTNDVLFNVLSTGELNMKTNLWHKSVDGKERLFFANNGQTYIMGGGSLGSDFAFYVYGSQATNYGTLLTITNDGYVGINGIAPSYYRLHVNGTTYFQGNSIIGGTLQLNGTLTADFVSVSSTNTDYCGIQIDTTLGSTYNYPLRVLRGTFTGFHRSFIDDEPLFDIENIQKFKDDYVGRIVIATGKISTHTSDKEGNWEIKNDKAGITIEDAVPMIQLSRTKKDKRVFGVLGDPKRSNTTEDRMIVNSVGEGGIMVCNSNGAIENGDYIQSSGIVGYGEKQDDDLLHNYTVAKATMDCNFELDSPLYQCFELDNGLRVAFIAATYHCG